MRHVSSPFAVLTLVLTAACGGGAGEKKSEDTATVSATPVVASREVSYTAGATPLKGFVAWDSSATAKRPGVLVVHEWWGENENTRDQARRLARSGYVGFALDMYGDGKSTTHPDSAQMFMQQATKDMGAMVARFQAALEQLKQDPNVDTTRIAAIGYCFGGAVVLGMAQSGMPLRAVVSFHGAMPPAAKVDSGSVKARMLVLAGGADPMVPMAQVDSFVARMKKAGATIGMVSYPGVMHGFTNPNADKVGMAGLKYDAAADQQSWEAMLKLFGEVLR